jgi:pseudouridine kinase
MKAGPHRAGFVCLGGATVDRIYRLPGAAAPGTSNPGQGRTGFGGVARNVAENLARLGERARLVSAVGDDADGHALIAALAAVGVNADAVAITHGERTADYVAIIDGAGDLALGVADMGVLDRHLGALQEEAFAALQPGDWLFGDCNAAAPALAALIARARAEGVALALDCISVSKARRLPADLTGVAALFLNRDEAAAVLGAHSGASLDPAEALAALYARGAERVVLTLGAAGAMAIDAAGLVAHPARAARPTNVTGAGDSHLAGVLIGLQRGWPLKRALALGAEIAARTVARAESVDPTLSPALVKAYEQGESHS